MILLYVLVGYIVSIWVLLRLIVPHLGFKRQPLSGNVTPSLTQKIADLQAVAASDRDYLDRAYSYVTNTYRGARLETVTKFWKAFQDPATIPPGFMPCNGQNYLLRLMLVKGGRFSEDDIKIKVVPFNFFIHQYLQVKVEGGWIDVDPWSAFKGMPVGTRSAYFG